MEVLNELADRYIPLLMNITSL